MMSSSLLFLTLTLPFGSPDSPKDPPPKIQPMLVDEKVDLSGYYTCKGQEAAGKVYTGVVMIEKKNEVYVLQWIVGGGSSFTGIGIRQGNSLAASWAIPNQAGAIVRGVNLYRVEATANGPRLVGRWASMPGPGVQQTETLNFLKKLEDEK